MDHFTKDVGIFIASFPFDFFFVRKIWLLNTKFPFFFLPFFLKKKNNKKRNLLNMGHKQATIGRFLDF